MNNTAVNMTEESNDQQVLVVVSKVKNYIRAKSGMNTASNVAEKLTEIVKSTSDQAIQKAQSDNRKTLMDRDFENQNSDESEVLVVVSKLKNYVRAKSGMNTAASVAGKMTGLIKNACDQAIEKAKSDGRKTVMDRDF
jgi:histone H3/H4